MSCPVRTVANFVVAWLVALGVEAGALGVARAEQVLMQQDGWTVAAGDRTASSAHCYAYIDFPLGSRVVFDLRGESGAATWAVMIGEHKGKPDITGQVTLLVDGQQIFAGQVVPMKGGKGARMAPIEDEGVRLLSVGNVLDVTSSDPQRYAIAGSAAVLRELASCMNASGAATVAALDNAADQNELFFNVRANIQGGFANMRSGPGVGWPVVGKVPMGQTGLRRSEACKQPDDGRTRMPWCPFVWNGTTGFISLANLENMMTKATPQPKAQPRPQPEVAAVEPPSAPPARAPSKSAAAPAPRSAEPSPDKKADKQEDKESTGTGFFVSSFGHILTNAHVIGECRKIQVQIPGTLPEPAQVMAMDKTNDLALLVSAIKPPFVPTLSTLVRTGDPVAVYGFPLSGGLSRNGNFTIGTVAATAGLYDNSGQIQISAPVQPGNSGGPVLDGSGNIIAVVVSKLNAMAVANAINDIPQNVNFAIKASVALNFLDTNSVPHQPPSAMAMTPLSNPDLADRAKTFTVFIACQ